ncbi:hypothetical protein [Chitinimonas sp.]|uniref:hypothetical protein n=1 Tax=Chitinimonas sp. TaxID=1934313 RepID=UPI002F95B930
MATSAPAAQRDGPIASSLMGAPRDIAADGQGGINFLDQQGGSHLLDELDDPVICIRHLSAQVGVSTLMEWWTFSKAPGWPTRLAMGSDGNLRVLYTDRAWPC